MSKLLTLHPSKRHPLTGRRLEAVGVLPNGKVIWPVLGSDDTVPPAEPPEGVTADEWEALGDPGKKAIIRERGRSEKAERELAASRARPAPPKAPAPPATPPTPPAAPATPQPGDQPDVSAIVQQAVEAALKPFQDREEQRSTQEAAGKVRDTVLEAAKVLLHDATDALTGIDLTKVVNDQGEADTEKVKTELDDLIKRKPHLGKEVSRFAPPGIGGGGPAAVTDAEKVKSVLADMQKATGVRLSTT